MTDNSLAIKVEFGGGMELLFSNQRSHNVQLPSTKPNGEPVDLHYLIFHMRDHMLKEREELFIEGDSVRPGILVLINDTDWELEGEGAYQLKSGDEITLLEIIRSDERHIPSNKSIPQLVYNGYLEEGSRKAVR